MAARFDLSEKLIHFTRGASPDDAFTRLRTIINGGRLVGGNRWIRGAYQCVCFTEAPPEAFADLFVTRFPFTRYSRFGLMFDKSWVFAQGGRPVIYQTDYEFEMLPVEMRWRYVRYEPIAEQRIDFTWEREWRINCDELLFSSADAVIVVPNEEWACDLRREHDAEQDMIVERYENVMEREIAELWRSPFRWRITALQSFTATARCLTA